VHHPLLALALVGGLYAGTIALASRRWERVTVNMPILRLSPGVVSGEVAFQQGDRLLFGKSAYRAQRPARGDVVLARVDGVLSVQRVLAVPGDGIELGSGVLHLNGDPLPDEAYPLQPRNPVEVRGGRLVRAPYSAIVRGGRYVVWGLRRWEGGGGMGPTEIQAKQILGKALVVYSPFRHRRIIDHLDPLQRSGADDGTSTR
jgi:signal peptidase I